MTSITPATLPERVKLPPHLYRVALLLGLSIFINYFDRGTLSLAAPFIKSDQGLSDYQLGIVLSAFFWTYASFQMISGWLVDRLDVNWVLFCGVALWCAATGATGFANSFYPLVAARLLLGVGESVAYPPTAKSLRIISWNRSAAAPMLLSASVMPAARLSVRCWAGYSWLGWVGTYFLS